MTALLIRDGYNCDGYLDVLAAQLRFKYRPMTAGQREQFFELLGKQASAAAKHKASCEAAVNHLVSWDVVNDKGEPEPITAENVTCLPPAMFIRMFGVISGSD